MKKQKQSECVRCGLPLFKQDTNPPLASQGEQDYCSYCRDYIDQYKYHFYATGKREHHLVKWLVTLCTVLSIAFGTVVWMRT